MKNTKSFSLIILLLFFYSSTTAQIIFEKGYIIDNSNERKECLIKNNDWPHNLSEFEYKLSENSPVLKGTIESISEFGIDLYGKYVRKHINIDRSEDRLQELGVTKEPKWSEETLFLRVLIESKLSLLSYEDGKIRRFFFQKEGSEMEQLIYKSYRYKNSQNIRKNNGFKQQLWVHANCAKRPIDAYKNLRYSRKELMKYFREENSCQGEESKLFYVKAKGNAFKLKIAPGLKYSSASFSGASGGGTFQKELSLRIGIELEYILPFNKNKWAVFVEPLYQSYYSEQNSQARITLLIDYKSIDIPIGVRYYLFLNPNLKLFFNGAYTFVNRLPSSGIRFSHRTENYLNINTRTNLGFGFGVKLYDKFSLEFRYHTPMKITNYVSWNSSFRSSTLIIGYTLLD